MVGRGQIARDDALPIYEQLAQLLVDKIGRGQFASGARLPTELDLAKDYGISRDTVRQAIAILERRGLVVRRRAKGTFVSAQRVTQELAKLRSFHGGLVDRGVVPDMELLEFRPVAPPQEFAAGFQQGEVVRLLRRYLVNGKALAVADIYLHAMAKAIPWEVAERHDTYTIFDKFLHTPVARASATIRAESAGRGTANFLGVRPSAAILALIQTHYSVSGDVLVQSALRVRADAYELHIDLLGATGLTDSLTGTPARRFKQGGG